MRLPESNLLFGIPVVMDTNDESLQPGQKVEMTYEGQTIAVLEVDSKWMPDKSVEALKCYGTSSLEHPGVLMIATERGKYYVGGKVCTPSSPARENNFSKCMGSNQLRCTYQIYSHALLSEAFPNTMDTTLSIQRI